MNKNQPISKSTLEKLSKVSNDLSHENSRTFLTHTLQRLKKITNDHLDIDILNAFEFTLLISHDVNHLIAQLAKETTFLGKSLYTRLLVLMIFESSKSFRSILSLKFRRRLVAVLSPKVEPQLKAIHSKMCKIFNECESNYGEVRNGLIGHIDKNPNIRLQLLFSVETKLLVDLGIEYLKTINELTKLFNEYFKSHNKA